jgi:hypothetical protein
MTSFVNSPAPGDDLAGRSALTLLACRSHAARVLYLVSRGDATVADSSGNAANCRISVDRAGGLPFLSGTFDVVILDLDAMATHTIVRGGATGTLVSEITRVMRRDAECLVITRSTRMPRNLSALRKYRVRLGTRVCKAMFAASSFHATSAGHLVTDDSRVLEVHPASAHHPAAAIARRPDYALTSFRRENPSRATVLEKVLEEVGSRMGAHAPAHLVTILVRKIGKTAVAAKAAGKRVIIRIPRTAVARARGERNFRALERLHRSEVLPAADRALIPEPLLEGRCYGYP